MTPAEHAATVREDARLRAQMIHGLNGHDINPDTIWKIIHRWDALAERATEPRTQDEHHWRSEARRCEIERDRAEARATELERERDEAIAAGQVFFEDAARFQRDCKAGRVRAEQLETALRGMDTHAKQRLIDQGQGLVAYVRAALDGGTASEEPPPTSPFHTEPVPS